MSFLGLRGSNKKTVPTLPYRCHGVPECARRKSTPSVNSELACSVYPPSTFWADHRLFGQQATLWAKPARVVHVVGEFELDGSEHGPEVIIRGRAPDGDGARHILDPAKLDDIDPLGARTGMV